MKNLRNYSKTLVLFSMLFLLSGIQKAAATDSQEPTFLKIEFTVKSAHRSAFMDIMQGLNSGMQSEKGFLNAEVYVDQDNQDHITLIEKWETRDLHKQHYDHIVANGSWAGILEMLTGDPAMTYHNAIEVR